MASNDYHCPKAAHQLRTPPAVFFPRYSDGILLLFAWSQKSPIISSRDEYLEFSKISVGNNI